MNLNQVTIPVSSVPKSILFYKRLGLRLIVHTHDAYARFESPQGDATFSIHKVEESFRNGAIVYFECENIDEKVAELITGGLQFDTLPIMQSWLWKEAHLRDPDGNKIILYEAGENRKNPPWKIIEE